MDLEVARRRADDERAPVLGDARARRSRRRSRTGPRPRARRHVQERAAAPEGRVRRLELVAVDRQALGVPARRRARGGARTPPRASTGSRPCSASAGSSSTRTTAPALCTIRPARGRSGMVLRDDARAPRARCDGVSPARRGRAPAGSSSRSPSAATPAARLPRRPSGRARAARRASGRRRRPRRRARCRASPRGGGPALTLTGPRRRCRCPPRRAGSAHPASPAPTPAPTSWRIWS